VQGYIINGNFGAGGAFGGMFGGNPGGGIQPAGNGTAPANSASGPRIDFTQRANRPNGG
jgi:hypothetical protein